MRRPDHERYRPFSTSLSSENARPSSDDLSGNIAGVGADFPYTQGQPTASQ